MAWLSQNWERKNTFTSWDPGGNDPWQLKGLVTIDLSIIGSYINETPSPWGDSHSARRKQLLTKNLEQGKLAVFDAQFG